MHRHVRAVHVLRSCVGDALTRRPLFDLSECESAGATLWRVTIHVSIVFGVFVGADDCLLDGISLI